MSKKLPSISATVAAPLAPSAPIRGAPTGTKHRLIVVDDHPVVREGLGARLNAEPDFQVVGLAADTHQAVDLVATQRPDLVITDLSLGGKPGLELVKDLEK